jgi:hypothetical protein
VLEVAFLSSLFTILAYREFDDTLAKQVLHMYREVLTESTDQLPADCRVCAKPVSCTE